MYLLLERFQLFIEEKNDNGIAIYENYNSHLRKKVELIHKWIVEYPDFPSNVRFNNIEKTVRNGDPIVEPMLQYADFLVYVPWKKCTTENQLVRRWDEIKHRYYNLDHQNSKLRGNVEI